MTTANITNIPAPRVAFIDERTGLMAREWYRFFLNLFVLTGSGSSDITVTDLAVSPVPQGTDPNLEPDTQLAAMQAQYDNAISAIQGAYLTPAAIPDTMPFDPIAFCNPRQEIGTLGAQDANNVQIGGGTAVLSSATIDALTTAGGAVLQTTNAALTDGAGIALGTLTTAPSAGDPTKWIGIDDNGTVRYVPAW